MEETSEELPNFFYNLISPDPTGNKNKAENNSQVARFANLSEDQLPQILAERYSLGTKKVTNWLLTTFKGKRLLRADPCCRSVIKEFAHAFSCAYIELCMHAGSLENPQKARVALGCASSYYYAFLVLSKLPACIHNTIYAREA